MIDAVLSRKGSAGSASDEEIFAGIDLLAATEGILTEPAGGTTIAVLKKLAESGELDPDEVVVAIITGNGLKTLDEHPPKPWPSMVECDSESMLSVLSEFLGEQAARWVSRCPPSGQWLEAGASASIRACSRDTRPAGIDASDPSSRFSASRFSLPVMSHSNARARLSTG